MRSMDSNDEFIESLQFFVDFRFDFSICSLILSLFLVKNYFTKKVIYLAEDRVDAMDAGR